MTGMFLSLHLDHYGVGPPSEYSVQALTYKIIITLPLCNGAQEITKCFFFPELVIFPPKCYFGVHGEKCSVGTRNVV